MKEYYGFTEMTWNHEDINDLDINHLGNIINYCERNDFLIKIVDGAIGFNGEVDYADVEYIDVTDSYRSIVKLYKKRINNLFDTL